MDKEFEKINDTISTDRTEELKNVSRETSNESSLTLTSETPQLRDNEIEYVDVTLDDFEGFTLGENPDIEGSWIPGSLIMNETRGVWTNVLIGQPLVNLPVTGETGQHYIDINFINNTTIRIYYYEVGGPLGAHGIGNSWDIHFINNTTQEDVTWNSASIGDGREPLANFIFGKSVYFAIIDNSLLEAGSVQPCIIVVSNSSTGYENLAETNTWFDFWYYPLINVPKWFVDNNVPIPTEYPNKPSTTEGGDGTFFRVDNDIDFPDKPNVSSLDSGFIGLYNPTKEIMQALANAMWNPDFSVIMNQMSPFDNIILFGSLPFLPTIEASVGLGIGNWSIPININKITDEYKEVDCGSISLNEFYGGFPDYNNEYLLYLPYIGYQPIRVDDFMDADIHVKYWCSAFSGACQCFVAREKDNHRKILYSFTGNCLTQFPISGSNYAQNKLAQSTGIMQTIASIGKGALVGGVIGGALAGAYDQYNQTLAQPKPEYNHSNGMSSDGGIFNIRKPYLIETSPIVNSPANYKHMVGIPSQIYDVLGNLEGYTEVSAINLDSINASKSEKDNLMSILKSGFYI